jgi:hypothetical protein
VHETSIHGYTPIHRGQYRIAPANVGRAGFRTRCRPDAGRSLRCGASGKCCHPCADTVRRQRSPGDIGRSYPVTLSAAVREHL